MQDAEIQPISTLSDKVLRVLSEAAPLIPYSAVPLEHPHIVFIIGRVEAFGYSADQILADRQFWMNVVHPADRERVFAALTKCRNCGIPFEIEYRIIHKDGSLHHVIDQGEPVFDDEGQITEIEGIMTDVTEWKKTEDVKLSQITEVRKFHSVNSSVFQKV